MTDRRQLGWLLLAALLLTAYGCGSSKSVAMSEATDNPAAPGQGTGQAPALAAPAETAAAESAPAEPFNPPTLAELDAKADWQDRPLLNAIKLLQDDQAKSKPLVSTADALALKNNTAEENTKILSALGRLPTPEQKIAWDAHITRFLLGDIKSPNPIMADSIEEARVSGLFNFAFFGFDWNLVPFADSDVAVSWQSSKDHLYDKVVMRRDLTWSDGKPITARDVEFSYHAIMNPKIPVPAVKSGTDKLKGVVAYDDYTVVYFHKESLATNDWNINFPVLPAHIFKPLYDKLESMSFDDLLQTPEYQATEMHPISGNAYDMTSRTHNQEINFKRRDDWYIQNGKQVRDKPYFEEVQFRIIQDSNTALLALMSGRLDEYEIQQAQWASQTSGADFYEKNTKAFGVEWTYFYFGWNNNSDSASYFKERKVREAMAYAFDYHELLTNLQHGLCEQCTGISNPAAWYAPKTPLKPYSQDLEKAGQLLDEAGWTDSDGDGVRDKEVNGHRVKFEFDMLVRQDPERIHWCELLKFNLEQLGVICNIKPMEATTLLKRLLNKEFQAECSGWGAGADPDTDENVWSTQAIKDGRNFLQYSNPEVDKLFDEGRKELDHDKRAAIYAKIDELIYRDQPCTFLFWRNSFFGFNKQLRGYKFSPRGPFDYSPGFGSFWKTAD